MSTCPICQRKYRFVFVSGLCYDCTTADKRLGYEDGRLVATSGPQNLHTEGEAREHHSKHKERVS